MTGYAFGLSTPRDLLEKARREVWRLERATSLASSHEDVQDTAFNAAVTLWHVSDWIARSTDQACVDAIERIKRDRPSLKTSPLPILQEYILDDPHMALCEALANGAKHLVLHESPSLVSTQVLQPELQSHVAAAPIALMTDLSASAIGEPPVVHHIAKVRINDVPIHAVKVFKKALAYWDRFFIDYGL